MLTSTNHPPYDLPPERVVVTVDRHANTSAASIPLALDAAVGALLRRAVLLCEFLCGHRQVDCSRATRSAAGGWES